MPETMTVAEAIATLDSNDAMSGVEWGRAVHVLREHARASLLGGEGEDVSRSAYKTSCQVLATYAHHRDQCPLNADIDSVLECTCGLDSAWDTVLDAGVKLYALSDDDMLGERTNTVRARDGEGTA